MISIRIAERSDAPRLNTALRQLSHDLEDTHLAMDQDIEQGGFGPCPSFYALLAEDDTNVVGAIVFSPIFSTTKGMAGTFISDLWVSDQVRGQGLGKRLLVEAARKASEKWGAGFIRLAVYHTSKDSFAIYQKLGFQHKDDEHAMLLDTDDFAALKS